MKESELEARFVRRIREGGGQCWKLISPGRAGVPDRLVLLPGGRVVFVELKTETGRLSPLQAKMQEQLAALGMEARVLQGREQVDAFVEEVFCGER